MYDQTYDYTGPLAVMVFKILNNLFGRSPMAGEVLSSLIIIIQAGIFNALLLKNKVYDENGYLPALLYVLLALAVPDFKALSPQLMSATFVLLALRNVFRRIGNQVTDELFLTSGIFIGLAAMLYLPSAVFFLVFLFSLVLFSSAILRRLLLYFFGFLLVFVACGLYFYVVDSFQVFLERAIYKGILLDSETSFSFFKLIRLSVPFLVILLLSVIQKLGSIRMTNFQQKVDQVMWILFLGGISTVLLSNERGGHELIFVVPVVAYFWTYYIILLRRMLFKAIMPALLVFGLLIFSMLAYKHWTDALLIGSGETNDNTLVLGERLESYSLSTVSSPFFNNTIGLEVLSELNNYQEAESFYLLFLEIDPRVVSDEMEIMPQLMQRFPYIESNYLKEGSSTYRKISN